MNRIHVKKYFDSVSEEYNTNSQRVFWAFIREKESKAILRLLPKSGMEKILELGSGGGFYTKRLRDAFPMANITCVDFSEKMHEKNNVIDCEKKCADFTEIDFEEKFNLIFSAGALEFIRDPYAFLKKIGKFLVPGGSILILVPRKSVLGLAYKFFHFLHSVRVHLFKRKTIGENLRDTKITIQTSQDVFPFSSVYLLKKADT